MDQSAACRITSRDDFAATVLVLEDEILLIMELQDVLEHAGYRAICISCPDLALQQIAEHGVDAAIVDYQLAGKTSQNVIAELERRQIPFLICTAARVDRSLVPHDVHVLEKPCSPDDIVAGIRSLTSR